MIDDSTDPRQSIFFLNASPTPPVVARLWYFRAEAEYRCEECAGLSSLELLRQILQRIPIRAYLLLTGELGARSAFRTRKGVLWGHEALRQLPNITFERQCDYRSRLAAVVDLSHFDFKSSQEAFIDRARSLIVLADQPLESLCTVVTDWVTNHEKSLGAFDFDAAFRTLHDNPAMGVLRYFLPNEPRPETALLVGHESLVTPSTCEAIDSLTSSNIWSAWDE